MAWNGKISENLITNKQTEEQNVTWWSLWDRENRRWEPGFCGKVNAYMTIQTGVVHCSTGVVQIFDLLGCVSGHRNYPITQMKTVTNLPKKCENDGFLIYFLWHSDIWLITHLKCFRFSSERTGNIMCKTREESNDLPSWNLFEDKINWASWPRCTHSTCICLNSTKKSHVCFCWVELHVQHSLEFWSRV